MANMFNDYFVCIGKNIAESTRRKNSSIRLNFDNRNLRQRKDYFASRKRKVPFIMAIGNGELMHECFPLRRMGIANMK